MPQIANVEMTYQQWKRVVTLKRRGMSIRGIVALDDGNVQIGYERSHDGRDRELTIDQNGRTIENRNTYR